MSRRGHFPVRLSTRNGHPATRTFPSHQRRPQVDDTAFASASKGTLYVVDNSKSQIIAITGNFHGQVFASAKSLGTVDLKTGTVSPIASGIGGPKGLLFVPAGENDQNDQNDK